MSTLEEVLRNEEFTETRRTICSRARPRLVLGAGGVGKGHRLRTDSPRRAGGRFRRLPKGRRRQLAKTFNCRSVDWIARHTVSGRRRSSTARRWTCIRTSTKRLTTSTTCGRQWSIFDAVYNPENTLLVKDARGRNCTVVTGIDMFVRQACLQFKLFTGLDGPAESYARSFAALLERQSIEEG